MSSPLHFRQNFNSKRKFSSLQTPSRTLQPHCNRQFFEVSNTFLLFFCWLSSWVAVRTSERILCGTTRAIDAADPSAQERLWVIHSPIHRGFIEVFARPALVGPRLQKTSISRFWARRAARRWGGGPSAARGCVRRHLTAGERGG